MGSSMLIRFLPVAKEPRTNVSRLEPAGRHFERLETAGTTTSPRPDKEFWNSTLAT
jgi:hypothetical protein